MKTQRHIISIFLWGLFLLTGALTASAQVRDLFNNTNPFAVRNGGAINPRFLLNVPTTITQLVTYHWNDGRGSRPGAIGLRGVNNVGVPNGLFFGPFSAIGTTGFNSALNVNWVANVNVNVPAGFYEVVDSDPSTWSNNFQSASQGFAIVRGFARIITPPPTPPPTGGGSGGGGAPQDRGSNNPNTPTILIPVASMPVVAPGLLGQTITDGIGGPDVNDYYFLNVTGPNGSLQPRGVVFNLSGFAGNVQLILEAFNQIQGPRIYQAGEVVATGAPLNGAVKTITRLLYPGNYRVLVSWTGAPTNYTLTITTPAR